MRLDRGSLTARQGFRPLLPAWRREPLRRGPVARRVSGSHGWCVNLRDYRSASALLDRVRVGDKVIVYRSFWVS